MVWSSPRTWTANEVVTAAHMNQEVRDNLDAALPDEVTAVAWAPNLEGATSGSVPASSGRQWRIGALEFVWARFAVTDPITGVFFVTLPSTAVGLFSSSAGGSGQAVGSWQSRDDSNVSSSQGGTVLLRSATAVHFELPVGGLVSDSSPFSWESGGGNDVLSFEAHYPIA